jgi:hypothetical protein
LQIGNVYTILTIHAQCQWYAERHYFEGKLMQCVEIFEEDGTTGFCFNQPSDCPDHYYFLYAFCFFKVVVRCHEKQV